MAQLTDYSSAGTVYKWDPEMHITAAANAPVQCALDIPWSFFFEYLTKDIL